jgi:hypothetical protein
MGQSRDQACNKEDEYMAELRGKTIKITLEWSARTVQ